MAKVAATVVRRAPAGDDPSDRAHGRPGSASGAAGLVGLPRFQDAELLFRGDETYRLMRLIGVYRGVILYGRSGTGKTSLINARLMPRAHELDLEPLEVRFQARSGQEVIVTAPLPAHRLIAHLPDPGDAETGGTACSIEDFRNALESACAEGCRPLIVCDQFEDLVTRFAGTDAQEPKQQIFDLIGWLLSAPAIKVLFAFREDYLSELSQLLAVAPELIDQAMRIDGPSAEVAKDVIRESVGWYNARVAERSEAVHIDLVAIDQIYSEFDKYERADALTFVDVEVVCLWLWSTSLMERRHDPGVEAVGGVVVRAALSELDPQQRTTALAVLTKMVTRTGERNVSSENDLVRLVHTEDRIDPALTERMLDALERDDRLVSREWRHGVYLCQLASEFLAPAVMEIAAVRHRRRRIIRSRSH